MPGGKPMRTEHQRVAVVHDWLVGRGGAEIVTRELVCAFDADVFALVDHLHAADRAFILGGKRARTTFIQHVPGSRRWFRLYLPLFPLAIERLDLSAYDVIISSSYAVAKGVRIRSGQKHICYIHTPMRYAWVKEEEYLHDHGLRSALLAKPVRWVLKRLRHWDLRTNDRIDLFVANGRNVADRVERSYGRQAEVLHPPVDLERFPLYEGQRNGYLAVGRAVPYKRVDRIIEAFREMPEEQLTVCGSGPMLSRWKRSAPANVRFTGEVDQDTLVDLYQRSRALILAADEDLGITPLEALACGTPSIALRSGGYLETLREGRSAIFFDEAAPAAIRDAVLRFETAGIAATPPELHEEARPFDANLFRERIRDIVERTIA